MTPTTSKAADAAVAGCLTVIVALLIRFLVVLIAWNYGLVSAVRAFGGHAQTIGFGTAIALALLLSLLRGVFSEGESPVTVVSNQKGAS